MIKPPKDYTVGEIIRATEGNLAPVTCLERNTNTCPRCSECTTLFVWEGLQKLENEYFDSITLQDILDKHEKESGTNYII